ncbi:MAG: divergent polysaccharide deacetylase family protein [Spirochaetales bacterium]|uniref:Divergent polysaccharide deacetylase family protein n=1 Tax=Candidatus Thalassospirochaeta sargassi TaxID=3119039 RepID=A0AAJ1MJ18_9SPIO|nr:divergent polysaccharide deacetylase family protein [Spirochaetales bacterium]
MSDKKKTKRGLSLKGLKPYYIIIGIIIVLLIIILSMIKNVRPEPAEEVYETYIDLGPAETAVPEHETSTIEETVPVESVPSIERNPASIPEIPEVEDGYTMAFIIDDVGNSIEQLKPFLEIPYPVTFAIMPDRKYTRECATMIKAAGKEIILHQPMESVGGADPGKSAIYTDMSEAEIRKTLEHNFKQLPQASGMNNHMGSAATSDERVMNIVMDYLSENDLFFLDSFTISTSLGKEAAKKSEVDFIKRNSMFLDNENDHASIQNAINEGKKAAKKNGHAVMIGHVMTGELAEIMLDLYPNFIEDGCSLKEISELFIEMNSLAGVEEE